VETLDNYNLLAAGAFIILGASGTYLLLPHTHGKTKPALAHRVGYALVALALLAFVTLWRPSGPFVALAFFYAFGIASIVGAIFTITSKNPIHSALWFASVVLATSGLFLLSGAQFLAAGTIIVYAGAIIVTFLFVIMLAQMEGRATYDRMARSPFWATFSSFLLLFGLTYSILSIRIAPVPYMEPIKDLSVTKPYSASVALVPAIDRLNNPRRHTAEQSLALNRALPATSTLPEVSGNHQAAGRHVAGLGATLYTEHLVTVELAGALLFAALIGALAIATPKAPIRPATSDAAPNAA